MQTDRHTHGIILVTLVEKFGDDEEDDKDDEEDDKDDSDDDETASAVDDDWS